MPQDDPGATADLTSSESVDPPVSNWDRYEIKELLGFGGMAQVFKAFDPHLKRFVALKFIRGNDPQVRDRVLKEARAQARLEHPHICKIYEAGEVQGHYFIAMQLIHGSTLAELQSRLLLEQKIKITQQVAEAVHLAHSMGIIHRDLKPTNIMVESAPDGGMHPYVMDFGIAREVGLPSTTATDQLIGTPSYMAPEQVFGDRMQLDRRTDIYCLGSTLYFLLAGRSPFEGTPLEVLIKVSKDSPQFLRKIVRDIPRDVETIVMKCLEREPNRRYESAKALSDDLKRYLNGDPVLAIPPSLTYRIEKKLRKNKVVASFLLLLLIAGVFAIDSRMRTAKQVRLTQEFTQTVEAMDWMIRVAHMAPLHDIRTEKRQILERMKMLQANMHEYGSLAIGPGNYALAKGYMAVQDYENAKKHLEQAWQKGYRTPETGCALGETMGALYQAELQRMEQISNLPLRKQRRKEIETRFRAPAIQYLKAGSGAKTQAPEYLEALIAFYDKRYDLALKKAAIAFKRLPWFYEAKILEGRILQTLGSEQIDNGAPSGAEKNLLRSELAYEDAVKIGESDPQAYRGICVIKNELFYSEFYGEGKNLDILKSTAADACERALLADPDDPFTHNKISFLNMLWAEHQLDEGIDSADSIQRALDFANRAIELEPNGAEGYNNAGMAYWQRAKSQSSTGKDAARSFQDAVKHLTHAGEIDPNNASTLNHLGLAYMDFGDFKMYHGQDPRSSYSAATTHFRKTLQISPNYFAGYVNLGIIYSAIGEYEMDHGYDPVASLQQAIEILDKARTMNPTNVYSYRWLLYVHRDLGEHKYHLGQNAETEFQAAERSFETGRQLQAKNAFLYSEVATISLVRAQFNLDHQASPVTNIEQARKMLTMASQYNESDAAIQSRIGDSYVLEARWRILQQKDPRFLLDKARTAFERAVELNPAETSALIGLAEQSYWLAQFQKSQRVDPVDSIYYGLNKIDKALKMNPASAEAYACKGMLLSLTDHSASEVAFGKALSLNRNLANRVKAVRG